jgi:serine/threonine-protein kinase
LQILEFIHHRGVIHRDLKPANLIRQQQDGKLVLIGFGAVKQMQYDPVGPAPINPTTIAVGTEGYMPTEQMRGKPRPNSDIYALGIIGIQAITGINPANLQKDRDGEVIWRSYVPEINKDLAAILSKMVRYHFKDRYQTATEVIQALKQLVEIS